MQALDLVATWPVGSAAAGILARQPRPGAPQTRPGVWLHATTGELDRPYPWASVTKLCTTLAVLVAVEEHTLSLEDVAGPPGSTVAHLLAHASGLAPDEPVVVEAPGRRRIYSNAGFEVLAESLETQAGMPFTEYLTEAVFVPLGMWGAQLVPGSSPAWGVRGGLADLLALGSELLSPSIVSPDTLARATCVAFPGLEGVLPGYGRQQPCDWGLGFEIRDAKRPHWTGALCSPATFGHFGRSGSFLWVDPVAGVGCGALADREWGPWAVQAWPAFSDAVVAEEGSSAGGPPVGVPRGRASAWGGAPDG
jgi:CubicO group peptidase (beta-lactamase class C family)